MSTASVQVIRELDQAASLMEPTRLRMMRELSSPDSATGLARRLGLPRQRVNYHLRELEKSGLVRLVEERRKRNCIERIVEASARSYLISPEILSELGTDPAVVRDRFSWSYLLAVAARTIKDLAILRRRADRAKKRLATLTIETEVRFATPDAMHAFADELANEVGRLVAKYHDERSPDGRLFRFFLGGHPVITKKDPA